MVHAGYHVIWSWAGQTVPQELFDATTVGKVGGVIFFTETASDKLHDQIKSRRREGESLARRPCDFPKKIDASKSPAAAAASAGSTVADVFSKYHPNGDLAPVLDVFAKQEASDSFERSFSMDPAFVRECSGSWITTLQSRGYIATAKHFPGVGAVKTYANTDLQRATLNVSLAELGNIDETPHRDAIKAGVRTIMPSWAVYPAVDSKNLSGLSKKWMQELRDRLQFRGVTIRDALEAGAIKRFDNTGELAILALDAGMDIVLASV